MMFEVHDLMYCEEREIYNDVKQIAENAGFQTEDGSDEIHRYRLVMKGEMPSRDDYYLWVLRNRLLGLSFALELTKIQEPETFKRLAQQVIAEFKAAEG